MEIVNVFHARLARSGSSNCQSVELNLRGQEKESLRLPENPWYYEVQDLGRIVAGEDSAYSYESLEVTRRVGEVLEKARKYAGFDF